VFVFRDLVDHTRFLAIEHKDNSMTPNLLVKQKALKQPVSLVLEVTS
jgi:hypothetical protein